jgi:hypothetical protein
MNDLAGPNSEPVTVDVDPRALQRPEPGPDVDPEALTRPAIPTPAPPPAGRRRRLLVVGASALAVVVAGGGFRWRHQVTADPRLEFSRGLNVYRDEASTDLSGIVRQANESGFHDDPDEVRVAFVPGGRLYATVGLYNGGGHDVRIERVPTATMFYWAFDRMSVASDPNGGRFEPFQPFTLRRGETRQVRLEFRLADCDPAALQPGGYSVLRALQLRYRILGVSQTAGASFNDETVALSATGECAHPLVD